ncbi:SDR family oxidoreductase [Methyloferula stellata]|uniref:SDR family oxidoreductase n=1 Tax=Methyloferula stellata TaxID=876270 RepID=UPI000686FD5F|nr:SDR family oxidoreductase [Methyloferula stellata]
MEGAQVIRLTPSRLALVTGAARRIGLRIAERLAQQDYDVILHCSPATLPETTAAAMRIAQMGVVAGVIAGDLADPVRAGEIIAEANAIAGPLSLLVNNASIFEPDTADHFDPALWERHFAVNLRAPSILARDFAAQLPPDEHGAIVNMIDQRVLRPTPQFFSYALSKAGLWMATRTMAQAFAPRRIRVNAIGPGPVLPNGPQGEAGFEKEVQGLPLKQAVSMDDIADAVLYLAEAHNVTGQMIAVDAGQHLAWETPDIVA